MERNHVWQLDYFELCSTQCVLSCRACDGTRHSFKFIYFAFSDFFFLLSWLVDFCLPFDGDAILLCTLLVFFSSFVATLSLLMTEYTLYIAIVAFSECNRVIRVRFILGVLSANNTKCYFTSFPRRARSHIWFLWMEFLVIVFFPYFSSFLRAFFHALPWYVFSSYCCCCCRCSNSCSSPFFDCSYFILNSSSILLLACCPLSL